jgi:RimJ/RimL family protein N-acetyltransferase
MIEAVKTTEEDVKVMKAGALQYGTVQWEALAKSAVTVRDDGEILGIGGIHWYWPKVGEAWVALHENALRKRYKTYRALKEVFLNLLKHSDWQRVQACVRADWKKAIRIVKLLGFEKEAVMRKYCDDGTDAYLYAMVR